MAGMEWEKSNMEFETIAHANIGYDIFHKNDSAYSNQKPFWK